MGVREARTCSLVVQTETDIKEYLSYSVLLRPGTDSLPHTRANILLVRGVNHPTLGTMCQM